MQGRLENDIKTTNTIMRILNELPDYVSDWYFNLKASSKTASSCYDFIRKIRAFLTFINDNPMEVKLEDITLNFVQKYIISIKTKTNSDGSVSYTSDSYQQTVWCALNNFLNYLAETNQIPKNHMKLIDKPKNKDLERINEHRILLTKKDFMKILYAVEKGCGTDKARAFQERLKSRDKAILALFMTTGMRETALTEINVDDLDLYEECLYITDKGNKKHEYHLDDSVVELLDDWMEDRENMLDGKECSALFISERKVRIGANSISELVKKYSAAALGYRISPHKLRAGFCSILYKETKDIEFVRRTVGHSNVATTQRYIVTKNDEKKTASKIMSSVIKL